jgi:hypothetical protein
MGPVGHAAEPADEVTEAWRAHLFANRSPDEIASWSRSLAWFRFCRAEPSPFVHQADRLLVALRWTGPDDLLVLLDELCIDEPPRSGPGSSVAVGRSPDGTLTVASAGDGWGRPGRQTLSGVRCEVVVGDGRLELSVSGEEQRRTEIVARDVDAARGLEDRLLGPVADRIIDPPRRDRSCVTPDRYPELFSADGTG